MAIADTGVTADRTVDQIPIGEGAAELELGTLPKKMRAWVPCDLSLPTMAGLDYSLHTLTNDGRTDEPRLRTLFCDGSTLTREIG